MIVVPLIFTQVVVNRCMPGVIPVICPSLFAGVAHLTAVGVVGAAGRAGITIVWGALSIVVVPFPALIILTVRLAFKSEIFRTECVVPETVSVVPLILYVPLLTKPVKVSLV